MGIFLRRCSPFKLAPFGMSQTFAESLQYLLRVLKRNADPGVTNLVDERRVFAKT